MAYGVSDTAIGSIFIDAEIAQLVEQRIRNAWVEGSSPFRLDNMGRLPAMNPIGVHLLAAFRCYIGGTSRRRRGYGGT